MQLLYRDETAGKLLLQYYMLHIMKTQLCHEWCFMSWINLFHQTIIDSMSFWFLWTLDVHLSGSFSLFFFFFYFFTCLFFRALPLMSSDPSSSSLTTLRTLPSPCRCTILLLALLDKVNGDTDSLSVHSNAESSQSDQNRFHCLSQQMSLREQCMWPPGWSWHVTLYTPSSRSLMLTTMTNSPTKSSLE